MYLIDEILYHIEAVLGKALWALKQTLPLSYRTIYRADGKVFYTTWRMWFGRSFSIEEVEAASVTHGDTLRKKFEWLKGHPGSLKP